MSTQKLMALIEKHENQLLKNDYKVNSNKRGPNYTEQIIKHLYSKLYK